MNELTNLVHVAKKKTFKRRANEILIAKEGFNSGLYSEKTIRTLLKVFVRVTNVKYMDSNIDEQQINETVKQLYNEIYQYEK